MSYRELRNFTEIMRALGYPRLISLENFRVPNFQLVADALFWMVKRYDPDIDVSDNIEDENDRVDFLTGVAIGVQNKAHIRLNARKLYSADGHAVKELLKLASLLYKASQAEDEDRGKHGGEGVGTEDGESKPPLASQLGNVKEARALATEITERGARLYELLGKEKEVRPQRLKAVAFLEAVSGSLASTRESELVESAGREILARMRDNILALERQCEDLEADETELTTKIKKKKAEVERGEKRLKSLQAHRPAFADEFDKLEDELRRYYKVYVDRFRNLDYLEHDLDRFHESEMEELEEYERKRNRNAERIRREQLKQFIGREPENESAIEEELLRKQYPGFDGRSTPGGSSTGGGVSGGGRIEGSSVAGSRGGSRSGGGGGGGRFGGSRGGTNSAEGVNGGGDGIGGRGAGTGGRSGRIGAGGGRAAGEDRISPTQRGASNKESAGRSRGRGRSRSVSGGSSSDVSGSDLNRSAVGTTSEDDEVSLNDSDETGSLIDEDDESSEDQASRSYSDSNDENF